MKTADFLVEIGTEELPPRSLLSLIRAFSAGIADGLKETGLAFDEVREYATPRRLAVAVLDLQLQGESESREVLGPPLDRAKDDGGNWTPAAQGFARKQGVEPEDLETADTDKGPRLAHRSESRGALAAECLGDIIKESIRALPIPRRMRWGAGRHEFVRPVHWVVALLGGDVLDCEILGLRATRLSRGHRFMSEGEIKIKNARKYPEQLESEYVVAGFITRRELIREQIDELAASVDAVPVMSGDLLNEVTALVEWPVALMGGFEERFLQVPAEALVSSMNRHQKYFHLIDADGRLLPRFIAVANLESKDPDRVVAGNERVIRPRLEDADFFCRKDSQRSLTDRIDDLDRVVFQQKLGTLLDKTRRLQNLAEALAEPVDADIESARRAAELSKADLLTLMVGEFPDMQGIAGRYYALADGESPLVANALEQQYWPRFAGDHLPGNPVASCLALADRLDTVVGIFGIGESPTGSSDPFSLRRAALGVLRILVEEEIDLDLRVALTQAADQYPDGVLEENTVEEVMTYMVERFRAWYESESIAVEVFNAVAAKRLSVPLDIHRRVQAVHAFTLLPEAPALAAANKRVSNILEKQAADIEAGEVSENLLSEPAEQALASQLRQRAETFAGLLEDGRYTEALASLAGLREPVDQFFDTVMVMADDEALRNNRLNLLRSLRELFLQVADISLLAVTR